MSQAMLLAWSVPAAASLAPRWRRVVRVLTGVLLAALAGHLLYTSTGWGGAAADLVINRIGANLVFVAAAALCALRARYGPDSARPWVALAVSIGLYAAGNTYYSALLYGMEHPPYPSWADAGWLAAYPPLYVCLGLLARRSVRRMHRSVWLDGLVAGLAVAALGASELVIPILANTEGDLATVVTNAAYPIGDLVLLSLTIGVVAVHGWRGRGLWLLAAGLAVFAVTDAIHLYRIADGTFVPGTVLDSLWVAGAGLMALAAWQPERRPGSAPLGAGAMLIMPLGCGLGALALLTSDAFRPVGPVPVGLASAAIAASMLRTALSFRELRSLAETRRQAATDELTELPNRRAFYSSLEAAIERAAQRGESLAVMLIDLDHFKDLNDTLGHHAGDLVLTQVGPRLRTALRAQDVLARLGGDEFAVLLPTADAAEAAGERIAAALKQHFSIDGIELHVAASVGVALYPEHGTDAETLMQRADVAMYEAKERRSGVELYARERDRHTRERLELIGELRAAVDDRRLVLHYQPKIDLRTGAVSGVEALLRWPHPLRGPVPPDQFIPLAEQTGVMRPLTSFVLDEAVRQAAEWRADGLELDMAVNVSATCLLDGGFLETVTHTLTRHGLPAERLIVEITEDVLMADPERSLAAVTALAEQGVRVSVDDFGTGYSSLAYLKRLPVAELKVDRSFVRDLDTDAADLAIVDAIVALGRRLDITVIAEGIENAGALARLRACGADGAQGFHFSRAVPPGELSAWLASGSLAAA